MACPEAWPKLSDLWVPGDSPSLQCWQEYASHLPGGLARDPSQLGAWLYSCGDTSHDEEAAISGTMPDLALQVNTCWPTG